MAKKSFVMYESWGAAISMMSDEQAGALIKAIYAYQNNPDVKVSDPSIAFVFEIIRQRMDEDNAKYRQTCEARASAGRKGNDKRWNDNHESQKVANAINKNHESQKVANVADNDTDTENDTDTVTDNVHPTDAKKDARSVRHKHGQYGHVMLTGKQYQDLVSKHGQDATTRAIKKVDEYCEETGKTYKNYSLVIERWGYDSAKQRTSRGQPVAEPGKYSSLEELLLKGGG